MFFWQLSLLLHVEHQIPAIDVLDDEEESRGALEAGMEADKEGMVRGGFEDVLFCLHPVDVFFVADQFFLDHFHRIEALSRVQTDQENLKLKSRKRG